jgi:hypothetical protein
MCFDSLDFFSSVLTVIKQCNSNHILNVLPCLVLPFSL